MLFSREPFVRAKRVTVDIEPIVDIGGKLIEN
jgi:hypothetical protein